MTNTTELKKDRDLFIDWLQKEKNIDYKPSKDYYYRCLRVERSANKDIGLLLLNEKTFLEFMEWIHQYGMQNGIDKKKAYVLVGTLRSAVKKYAEFKNPDMLPVYQKRSYSYYF